MRKGVLVCIFVMVVVHKFHQVYMRRWIVGNLWCSLNYIYPIFEHYTERILPRERTLSDLGCPERP